MIARLVAAAWWCAVGFCQALIATDPTYSHLTRALCLCSFAISAISLREALQ